MASASDLLSTLMRDSNRSTLRVLSITALLLLLAVYVLNLYFNDVYSQLSNSLYYHLIMLGVLGVGLIIPAEILYFLWSAFMGFFEKDTRLSRIQSELTEDEKTFIRQFLIEQKTDYELSYEDATRFESLLRNLIRERIITVSRSMSGNRIYVDHIWYDIFSENLHLVDFKKGMLRIEREKHNLNKSKGAA